MRCFIDVFAANGRVMVGFRSPRPRGVKGRGRVHRGAVASDCMHLPQLVREARSLVPVQCVLFETSGRLTPLAMVEKTAVFKNEASLHARVRLPGGPLQTN